MKLRVLELAYFEIEDGKEYYNLQQEKLGDRFKAEIQISIDYIITTPLLYPEVEKMLVA